MKVVELTWSLYTAKDVSKYPVEDDSKGERLVT